MPRQRQPTPIPRPDWRDPDMPVLVKSNSANDLIAIEPARWQRVCAYRVANDPVPTWCNDPTYNLRRSK